MKIRITLALAVLAPVSMLALLGWVLGLHGTAGLLRVEIVSRVALLAAAALGLSPAVLALAGLLNRWNPKIGTRHRTPVAILASAGIILALCGFAYLAGFPASPATDTTPRLVVAATSGPNGIPDVAIATNSRAPVRQTLTWGTGDTQTTLTEESVSRQHVFTLHDLKPATEYWYRVDGGRDYRFSTAATASQPLRFAVGSDAHYGASDSRNDLTAKMLSRIASPANRFDYFFSLGDNVEFGFRPEQWNNARASFAALQAVIPSVFAAGNHDALFTGLGRYLDFCYPASLGTDGRARLWYRFDVGNVHFIVLDLEWSAEAFTAAQATWLEQELQSIPADDWTIIMNHGFYYGSGSVVRGWRWHDNPDTITRVTPLFERYGVDVVFSGHAHQMELLDKSGTTYVIAGAFGGIPDGPRTYASPASRWYAAGVYGYVDVSVDASSLVIIFRDSDGSELKTTTLHK
jgi:predicted MPP superfamily phosphohydrolase